jgi:hypothetical protein
MIAVYFLLVSIVIFGGEFHFIILTSGADCVAGAGVVTVAGAGAGAAAGAGFDSPQDTNKRPADINNIPASNLESILSAISLLLHQVYSLKL